VGFKLKRERTETKITPYFLGFAIELVLNDIEDNDILGIP